MLQAGAQHWKKEQVSKRDVSPSHLEMNFEPCRDHECTAVTLCVTECREWLVSLQEGQQGLESSADALPMLTNASWIGHGTPGLRSSYRNVQRNDPDFHPGVEQCGSQQTQPHFRDARLNPFVFRHPVHQGIGRYRRRISLSPLDSTGMSLERVSTLLDPFPPSLTCTESDFLW